MEQDAVGDEIKKIEEEKEKGGMLGEIFPELEDIITFPSLGDMEEDLMSSKNTWFSGFQEIELSVVPPRFSSTTIFNSSVFEPKIEHLWKTVDDHKMEERKQKLSRYRKKRTERNFGKKIQVA